MAGAFSFFTFGAFFGEGSLGSSFLGVLPSGEPSLLSPTPGQGTSAAVIPKALLPDIRLMTTAAVFGSQPMSRHTSSLAGSYVTEKNAAKAQPTIVQSTQHGSAKSGKHKNCLQTRNQGRVGPRPCLLLKEEEGLTTRVAALRSPFGFLPPFLDKIGCLHQIVAEVCEDGIPLSIRTFDAEKWKVHK